MKIVTPDLLGKFWERAKVFCAEQYAEKNHTHSNMTAASSSTAGNAGLVPAPAAGEQMSYLRGDGTWAIPANTTYSAATSDKDGLMSKDDRVKLDSLPKITVSETEPASPSVGDLWAW